MKFKILRSKQARRKCAPSEEAMKLEYFKDFNALSDDQASIFNEDLLSL